MHVVSGLATFFYELDIVSIMHCIYYVVTASITNGLATVRISGLACGVVHTIIAGGTLNGSLVGPSLSFGTITGPCPVIIITPMSSPSYGKKCTTIKPERLMEKELKIYA